MQTSSHSIPLNPQTPPLPSTFLAQMSALKKLAGPLLRVAGSRAMATGEAPGRKVAVMGAAGGIGQPLSLLMKVKRKAGEAARGALCAALAPHAAAPFTRSVRVVGHATSTHVLAIF
jgi:hypothetical protein